MSFFGTAITAMMVARPGAQAAESGPLTAFHNQVRHSLMGPSRIDGLLLAGFVGGVVSFFKGFGVYRTYRVVEDVPPVPMRGVAMGLAHVSGKAAGDATVWGPVSQTPCLFYEVVIERWISDGRAGRWARAKVECNGNTFSLEDASGKVLVDLHGADFMVAQSAQCEMDPVSAYAAAAGERDMVAPNAIGASDDSGARCRLTEFLVLPGQEYDVIGTCTPNPSPKDESDRNLICKGSEGKTFLISDESARTTRTDLRQSAAAKVFGGAVLAILCLAALLAHLGFL